MYQTIETAPVVIEPFLLLLSYYDAFNSMLVHDHRRVNYFMVSKIETIFLPLMKLHRALTEYNRQFKVHAIDASGLTFKHWSTFDFTLQLQFTLDNMLMLNPLHIAMTKVTQSFILSFILLSLEIVIFRKRIDLLKHRNVLGMH